MRLDVADLTKSYGSRTVVSGITFQRTGPSITGLVGANGSGKSTTLRMLLGFTRPDSGRALFDGRPFTKLPDPGRTVGVMLDAQANHRGRTGREILALSALTMGLDRDRVEECLELVGLRDAARKRFGQYSLGMKQRLGVAQSLLARPSMLIYDEPANGLDPQGILWMRDLLRDFAAAGGTVLLSSHQLAEIEQIADSVIMIADGRVVADSPVQRGGAAPATRILTTSQDQLALALRQEGIPFTVDPAGPVDAAVEPVRLGELCLRHRLVVCDLRPAPRESLESAFLRLSQVDPSHRERSHEDQSHEQQSPKEQSRVPSHL